MISDDGGDGLNKSCDLVACRFVRSTSDIDFHDGRVRCAQRCTDGQTDRQTRTHSYEALAVAVAQSCLCFSITAEGGGSLSTLIRRVRCWWRGLGMGLAVKDLSSKLTVSLIRRLAYFDVFDYLCISRLKSK
ncbi:ELM2 domain containing protein [Brugia malayi]|uniref:BMA-LIN-40, isoform d n=1 Tax=Brugia malayi TaxID=6279 RepID=A0A0K0JLG4_BRUMA|nr:ELM2 domain containing protein [Brugia malayi]CDQ03530.1 BMA-LIN-40, isoform d [Brugia malayi]VIO99338.1 ELM2 domain containing protein [Brugia malayi]